MAPEQASVARGQFKWLSVTLAGCVLACFANPWFWRGAVMPFQTILFLRRYHIAGRTVTDSLQHPWAIIGELYGPFIPYLARSYASWAMYLLLGLASVAGVTAILRRQWGLLIVLASMAWAAMSVRRNIALLGMLVGPVAVIILWQAWQSVVQPALAKAQPKPKPLLPRLATGLSALALVAGLYWIHDVASQNFYQREWRPWEFGSGVSHLAVPVSAADWLTVHRPSGRVFTDLETSSNLMFFTQPHPEMPLLTNTWAMPPSIMEWAYRLATAQEDWRPAFDALDVQVVVLNSMFSRPLIKSLAHDGNWAVVSLDMKHVAFLRKNGPNAALAVGAAIRPDSLDVAALCRSLRAAEAVPSFAVTNAADLVLLLGWRPQAIEMWKESLRLRPDNYEVHNVVGHCLALQGCARLQAMVQLYQAGRDAQGDKLKDLAMEDWRQAKQHFEQALQIRPDYSQARHNLGLLQQDQEDFLQHRVPQYPDEDASPRVGVETMAF